MLHLTKDTDYEALIKENQEKQTDQYIIKNRGKITASKLKDYGKSPEYFFRKYILEEAIEGQEEEEKACFIFGTAVDDFITYGEVKFETMYFLDEGLLKPELEALALKKGIELEAKETVFSLKSKIYGQPKEGADPKKTFAPAGKIRLTEGNVKKLKSVIKEFRRQKLFDYDGEYEKQKVLTANYKGLELKATLDRYRESKIVNNVIRLFIRDTKTAGDIIKVKFRGIEEFGYDISMSFYTMLGMVQAKREHKLPDLEVESDTALDICQSGGKFPSWFVKLPPELIAERLGTQEEPGVLYKMLDALDSHLAIWNSKKDPALWYVKRPLDEVKDLDLYSQMETTIQQDWDFLQ